MRGSWLVFTALLALGCAGDDPASEPDSAADDGEAGPQDGGDSPEDSADDGEGEDGPAEPEDESWRPPEPAPPVPPAPPQLIDWACPEGWGPLPIGEGETWAFSACDVPETVPCRGATAQFVGSEGCEPIGTECPPRDELFHSEERIRALAPGYLGPILYVEPDRERAGDGSRRRPLSTIGEVLERQPEPGAIIAVAPGELHEYVHVAGHYAVVGMCASDTVIELPVRQDEIATMFLDHPDGARAANLTLRGRTSGVSIHGRHGVTSLKSVLVDRPEGTGIIAVEGHIEIEEVVVRGTAASDGAVVAPAFGFVATQSVTVRRAVADHPGGSGLIAQMEEDVPGTMDLSVQEFTALGQTTGDAPPMSLGVGVAGKIHLRLKRSLIEGFAIAGVSLGAEQRAPAPSTADVEDLIIRGHDFRREYLDSAGIGIREGATATLRRVRIDDGPAQGVSVGRSEDDLPARMATLTAEDLLLRRGAQGYTGELTHGVVANMSTSMALARVVIVDQQGFGFFTTGNNDLEPSGSRVDDMVIKGITSEPTEPSSLALGVGMSASFDGQRILLEDIENFGLVAMSAQGRPPPKVRAKDVWINSVRVPGGRGGGAAVAVVNGADVALTRAYVGSDGYFGVYMINELGDHRSKIEFTDLEIAGSDSVGMQAHGDVFVTLSRVAIRDAGLWGLGAGGERTPDFAPFVSGTDVLVENVRSSNKGRLGTGMLFTNRATADLGRVTLRNNMEAAVFVERDSSVFLREATLSDTQYPDCRKLPVTDTLGCTDPDGQINAGGGGVLVNHGGVVSLEDFLIENNVGVGLYASADSEVTAHRGRIRGNAIGLDLSGATPSSDNISDVKLEDNDRDASRSSLRPPDPGESVVRVDILGG